MRVTVFGADKIPLVDSGKEDLSQMTSPVDWLTSDWHLCHANILKYEPVRPYNYDECVISDWEARVREKDTVYMLGDIFFNKHIDCARKYAFRMSKLPGEKVLIKGNHDKLENSFYEDLGWRVVDKGWEVHITNRNLDRTYRFLFSHYPLVCHDGRYAEDIQNLNNIFSERNLEINVHGHTHSKEMSDKRCVNVSLEVTSIRLTTLQEVVKKWHKKQSIQG